jgi:hypothetical protein
VGARASGGIIVNLRLASGRPGGQQEAAIKRSGRAKPLLRNGQGARNDSTFGDSVRRYDPPIDGRRSRRRRTATCLCGWRHIHDPCVGGSDGRALLPHRHARAGRRRSAPSSSRFRGDVHASGGRARLHLPWQTQTVRAGSTVNIPANAPHAFKNMSGKMARMLCLCAPAGQEELFLAIGFPVDSRTAPAAKVSPEAQAEKGELLATLAPQYRTEILAR